MSKTVHISSASQLQTLCSQSTVVVLDFYADWCQPCKTIAPIFEQLSASLSRPKRITFAKIDTESQKAIAQTYNISALPTFLIIRHGLERTRIQGANAAKLQDAVKKLASEAESIDAATGGAASSSSSADFSWLLTALPKGYIDISEEIDKKGLDLLNADGHFGSARTLLEGSKPSTLDEAMSGKGKQKEGRDSGGGKKDWVESDTDEQLMLFVPFNATCRVHSLYITSLAPGADSDDADVMRPKTINLYTNSPHNLGFEEAEAMTPTQAIELKPSDWDKATGTARVELRFVKFQKVSSLVVFVVDGEGSGERVRLDRIKIVGESGEKRNPGKLEKIEHE